jgi:hypothetical protein
MRKEMRRYEDRREYLKVAVARRRRILKLKAVARLGSKCAVCGYDKHPGVLDFHHQDPSTKNFGVSSGGLSRSWKSVEDGDRYVRFAVRKLSS